MSAQQPPRGPGRGPARPTIYLALSADGHAQATAAGPPGIREAQLSIYDAGLAEHVVIGPRRLVPLSRCPRPMRRAAFLLPEATIRQAGRSPAGANTTLAQGDNPS